MSTHAYYKDRLGFDPDEVNGDGGYDKSQQGYEENLSKFKGNYIHDYEFLIGVFFIYKRSSCTNTKR